MGSVPANYPPPWRVEEAIARPTDSEPIEVGVLIVGAGPAGLACAIRLGQLLAELGQLPLQLGVGASARGCHRPTSSCPDRGVLVGTATSIGPAITSLL